MDQSLQESIHTVRRQRKKSHTAIASIPVRVMYYHKYRFGNTSSFFRTTNQKPKFGHLIEYTVD